MTRFLIPTLGLFGLTIMVIKASDMTPRYSYNSDSDNENQPPSDNDQSVFERWDEMSIQIHGEHLQLFAKNELDGEDDKNCCTWAFDHCMKRCKRCRKNCIQCCCYSEKARCCCLGTLIVLLIGAVGMAFIWINNHAG